MIKKILFLIMVISPFTKLLSQNSWTQELSRLKTIVEFLSSDSLKGRKPGTGEDFIAAKYIENCFKQSGLKTSFQEFELITGVRYGTSNYLKFNHKEGILSRDFVPCLISANNKISGSITFLGYGLEIKEDSLKWSDFSQNKIKGRWVMVLKGEPATGKQAEKFYKYSDDLTKILLAKDFGAIGVILISGTKTSKNDILPELKYEKNSNQVSIPVIQITRNLANSILKNSGYTIEGIEDQIIKTQKTINFEVRQKISVKTSLVFDKVITRNVIGYLSPENSSSLNEYIVVGAHMDHLGFGGTGSGSRRPDTFAIHNGADDNASGVAAIIDLSEIISGHKKQLKRGIYFVAFGAEEYGLIGSKYFVSNPPVNLSGIKAMFNFDMIGRFDSTTGKLVIGGTGTSVESDSLCRKYSGNYTFNVNFSPEGYGPSDHASFYLRDIPVFYFTTGPHLDYHTPFDDASKINYPAESDIIKYAADLILDVAERPNNLSFRESGSKNEIRYGSRLKVKLGIMPDFASNSNNGLRVDAVTPGGPAYNGGILKGDIIVAMDGKSVKNIYDYMSRLEKFEPGQLINVDVLRGDKKIVLMIRL